jgi:DNA invertase Pin-like site-specific DNA recombinase
VTEEMTADAMPEGMDLYHSNFLLLQSLDRERQEDRPMRLVAYTRLSQANAHEGESHEAQRQRIEAWATDAGHEVVLHTQDTVSGENGAEDRPGFVDALDALTEGEADGIVVSSIDRLARKLTTQEALLTTVWRRGGHVYEVGMGEVPKDDPGDPYRTFVRQVLGAAAQLERALIVKRMGDGRRNAIKRGRLIGPAPSFGWLRDSDDRGQPVPDPDSFPLVEEAVRRKEAGDSLRSIGAWLAEQTDRPWHPPQVQRIIERHKRYSGATR